MENFTFRNWETMLHMLPGLQRLCGSLIEDAQTGEPLETLQRRFAALEENIAGMACAALQLDYTPRRLTPLVEALQQLNTVVSDLYCDASSGDYERVIQAICAAQRNMTTFVAGLREVENLLSPQGVLHSPQDAVSAVNGSIIVNG
jgi:hypothetical protein